MNRTHDSALVCVADLAAEIVRMQAPPVEIAEHLNKFHDKKMLQNWLNLNADLSPNYAKLNQFLKP